MEMLKMKAQKKVDAISFDEQGRLVKKFTRFHKINKASADELYERQKAFRNKYATDNYPRDLRKGLEFICGIELRAVVTERAKIIYEFQDYLWSFFGTVHIGQERCRDILNYAPAGFYSIQDLADGVNWFILHGGRPFEGTGIITDSYIFTTGIYIPLEMPQMAMEEQNAMRNAGFVPWKLNDPFMRGLDEAEREEFRKAFFGE